MNLDYVHIELKSEMPLQPFEFDDFLPKYTIMAKYPLDINDFENTEDITVAMATIVLLERSENASLAEACDAYDEETWQLYQVVFNDEGDLIRPPLDSIVFQSIWHLKQLAVVQEYQGKGLGSAMIEWIIKFLCREQGAIILKPVPFEVANLSGDFTERGYTQDEIEKKLRSFCEQQGFFKLWATPYMYRVLEWEKGVVAL